MRKGTKSLLFGVHQFLWHPVTVWLAWIWLYRELPSFKETVCIIVHDFGYWGKENMDDEAGGRHPEAGARIAHSLLDKVLYWEPTGPHCQKGDEVCVKDTRYHDLCLYHSRFYARNAGKEPSKLCWADKLSIMFEPWWLYLPRAMASGELYEYRRLLAEEGTIPAEASHREWFRLIKARNVGFGETKSGKVKEVGMGTEI